MNLIRQVLTASDLSASSMNALDRAQAIARGTGAKLAVIHAMPIAAAASGEPDGAREAARLIGAHLDASAQDGAEATGEPVQVLVEAGAPGETIAATARSCAADLLVIGPHGERGMLDLFTGSTARMLMREAPCPILVAKRVPDAPYRRVMVAIDFSPLSPLLVRMAREIAPDAVLTLLNVFDLPVAGMLLHSGVNTEAIEQQRVEARHQALQALHSLAAEAGLARGTFLAIAQAGEATRSIVEQAAQEQCELLVMGRYGKGLAGEWLLGSVTREVLDQVSCDLLCVIDTRPMKALTGDAVA